MASKYENKLQKRGKKHDLSSLIQMTLMHGKLTAVKSCEKFYGGQINFASQYLTILIKMDIDNVIIRSATRDDMKHVMDMIQELADFEKMPYGPKITTEILEHDAFDSNPPLFRCFTAEYRTGSDIKPIGYSIFFNIYSTWEGKSLMLEDIYIKPQFRKIGAGKKMIKMLAKHALDTGCCRLDFHVLKWNPARKFYEHLGAMNMTSTEEWLMYRFNRDNMEILTKK